MATQSPISYTIEDVKSPEDFPGFESVMHSAFNDSELMGLMWPASPNYSEAEQTAFAVKVQTDIWKNDPSARYQVAKLPSGEIIGIAKWNFFLDSGPQHPFPKVHAPNANVKMVEWFFGKLDDARNKGLEGKKHALMALLAIKPEYQRIGLGTKLLQWGLRKCDEEGLDCWIDASAKGLGLYEKHGWKECGVLEIDCGDWGGQKAVVQRTTHMVRRPQIIEK